ncbi:hypothetical protein BMR07_00435 [Methylococcaceae bacterium CS1]|nr:hypothetical protein BMR07_00435 [Methylococcaceae bacterium CS1]
MKSLLAGLSGIELKSGKNKGEVKNASICFYKYLLFITTPAKTYIWLMDLHLSTLSLFLAIMARSERQSQ